MLALFSWMNKSIKVRTFSSESIKVPIVAAKRLTSLVKLFAATRVGVQTFKYIYEANKTLIYYDAGLIDFFIFVFLSRESDRGAIVQTGRIQNCLMEYKLLFPSFPIEFCIQFF